MRERMPDIHSFEPLWNEWYIKEKLGSGSYGTVYKIEKRELGESYFAALKHIPIPSSDVADKGSSYGEETEDVTGTAQDRYRDLLDSLLAEIKINNRLKGYTNIVSYEDHRVITRPEAMGYDVIIKMELLTSLPEMLRQRDLTVADVARLGREIATALTVLQRNKIIHRDIKPANIFVNAGGNFKLGDFGVAKVMEQASEGMSMRGTLSYMAPEVVRGEVGDFRLDIYSLGLVLYRLLNYNRGPFLPLPPEKVNHTQASEANRRRMRGETMPPPAVADEALGRIILRACSFRPEDRWSGAEEMRQQLDQYLRETPADTLSAVALKRQGSPRGDDTANASVTGHTGTSLREAAMERLEPETAEEPSIGEKTVFLAGAQWGAPEPEQEERSPAPPIPPSIGEETVLLSAAELDEIAEDKTELLIRPKAEKMEQPPRSPEPAPRPALEAKQPPAPPPSAAPPRGPTPQGETGSKTTPDPQDETAGEKRRSGPKIILLVAIVIGVLVAAALLAVFLLGDKQDPAPAPTPEPPTEAPASPSVPAVAWRDPILEAGIRRVLDKPQGDILPEELAQVQELRLSEEKGRTVDTLDDLLYLSDLKTLDLSGLTLQNADMSALGRLTGLEALNLTDCGLAEIDELGDLAEIQNLALGGNQLTSLWFVGVMPHLTYLDISGNAVTNLGPLRHCSELKTLIANGVPAADWTATEGIETVVGMPEPTPEPTSAPTPAPTPKPTPAPTVGAPGPGGPGAGALLDRALPRSLPLPCPDRRAHAGALAHPGAHAQTGAHAGPDARADSCADACTDARADSCAYPRAYSGHRRLPLPGQRDPGRGGKAQPVRHRHPL